MSRQTRYYLGRPSGFAAEFGRLPDVRRDPRRVIPQLTLDVIAKGSARGTSRPPPRVARFFLGFGFRSFIRRTLSLYEIRPPPRAAPPPEIQLAHIARELEVHFRLPGGSAGGRRGSDNGGIHGYASGATFGPRRPTSAISGGREGSNPPPLSPDECGCDIGVAAAWLQSTYERPNCGTARGNRGPHEIIHHPASQELRCSSQHPLRPDGDCPPRKNACVKKQGRVFPPQCPRAPRKLSARGIGAGAPGADRAGIGGGLRRPPASRTPGHARSDASGMRFGQGRFESSRPQNGRLGNSAS